MAWQRFVGLKDFHFGHGILLFSVMKCDKNWVPLDGVGILQF